MEENLINTELEQMRQQLSQLKSELNKQQIVSDRLLRQTVNAHMSKVRQNSLMRITICTLGVFFCPHFFWRIGYSDWYGGFTALIMLITLIHSIRSHMLLRKGNAMTDNLVDYSKLLLTVNEIDRKTRRHGLAMLCLWIPWTVIETYCSSRSTLIFFILSVWAVVCGVIGYFIGTHLYRKRQRAINDMVNQIASLTEE